jgi:hypothetical protein
MLGKHYQQKDLLQEQIARELRFEFLAWFFPRKTVVKKCVPRTLQQGKRQSNEVLPKFFG